MSYKMNKFVKDSSFPPYSTDPEKKPVNKYDIRTVFTRHNSLHRKIYHINNPKHPHNEKQQQDTLVYSIPCKSRHLTYSKLVLIHLNK